MSTALDLQRTPALIAAEINNIKAQTRTMVLYNSIEIGRRLAEAKQCIPHGEWGKWLESSVDYSHSTANNLMRIFEEYGADQLALFGETGAKSQALGSLSYTQAVALLSVPEEEREQFIDEHDLENMSTRELQAAIKERDQARKEKEEAEQKLKDAQKIADDKVQEIKDLQDILDQERLESKEKIKKLESSAAEIKKQLETAQAAGDEDEIKRLKLDLEEADAQLLHANEEIAELNKQLMEKPIETTVADVVEKIPEEVEKELEELRKNQKSAGVIKFTAYFEELKNSFGKLLATLGEMEDQDREKYSGAVTKLIGMMGERL